MLFERGGDPGVSELEQAGQECGMAFENYQDMRIGDVIECYNVEEIRRTL